MVISSQYNSKCHLLYFIVNVMSYVSCNIWLPLMARFLLMASPRPTKNIGNEWINERMHEWVNKWMNMQHQWNNINSSTQRKISFGATLFTETLHESVWGWTPTLTVRSRRKSVWATASSSWVTKEWLLSVATGLGKFQLVTKEWLLSVATGLGKFQLSNERVTLVCSYRSWKVPVE
jgi:hypothetical protein